MKEYIGTVSTKGQITLPAEIRMRLGIKRGDKVIFSLDQETVTLKPGGSSLEAGFKSIPALKHPYSLEKMTQIAAEEHAAAVVREAFGS